MKFKVVFEIDVNSMKEAQDLASEIELHYESVYDIVTSEIKRIVL